jgi:hypothetical protein
VTARVDTINRMFYNLAVAVLLLVATGGGNGSRDTGVWMVEGFANFMTSEFCDRRLVKGEIIMNSAVVPSDERVVIVKKLINDEEIELRSGDAFSTKDILKVYISELPSGEEAEHVFEVSGKGVGFQKGGCEGRRSAKNGAVLEVANAQNVPLAIVGAWARGHEEVKLTPSFILKAAPPVAGVPTGKVKPATRVGANASDPIMPFMPRGKMDKKEVQKELHQAKSSAGGECSSDVFVTELYVVIWFCSVWFQIRP